MEPKPRLPVMGDVHAVVPSFSLMQNRASRAESPKISSLFKTGELYWMELSRLLQSSVDTGRKFAHVASSGSNSDSFGSEGRDNRSAEVSSASGDKNSFHSPY